MTDVVWQAAAAEASFGIGDSVATKSRMGAQASSRAREELRPRGHSCLYRGRLGFSSEIYHDFAGIRAEFSGMPVTDCAQSTAIPEFVMRLNDFGDFRSLRVASI
jgi:hypothetical protein